MTGSKFERITSSIHPRNLEVLRAESRDTGMSVSELVNDAVSMFARVLRGEHALGGRSTK